MALVPPQCAKLYCAPESSKCSTDLNCAQPLQCYKGGCSKGACIEFSSVTNTVSFSKNVIPIFQSSCNFSACHDGSLNQPQEGLDLGINKETGGMMTAAQITAVHDSIVGKSAKRSTLHIVEPGSPEKSWLIAKVTYDDFAICPSISKSCTAKGCGNREPENSPPLDQNSINTLVAWVKGGAKND